MSDISQIERYTPHVSCLESHYMRLIARWQTTAAAVTLQDIADELGCSRRYTRLLLQSMMARQWLSWTGKRGQGGRGRLHCRIRDITMQENPKISPKSNIAPFLKDEGSVCESAADSRVCINFYRSIDTIVPSDHTGRVERHLLNMVHAGLTRIDDKGVPEPDVATAVEKNDNAQIWWFHLRTDLFWHNGEPVKSEQLLQSLKVHLKRPAFEHVISAELANRNGAETLVLKLSRPDAMLAYRLADPVHGLAHPHYDETGLGPFALKLHDDRQLLLKAFDSYHGPLPRVQTIEYSIKPMLPGIQWTTLSLLQPSEKTESARCRYVSENSAGFIYLAFNARKGRVTPEQQSFLRALIGIALRSLNDITNVSSVSSKWATMASPQDAKVVLLPPTLSLGYFWTPETNVLMKNFQRQLRYWGCKLTLCPIDANLWFLPEKWDVFDIGVSDLRFQIPWWFAAETRFHHSVMIRQFVPEILYKRMERILARLGRNETRYPRYIYRLMRILINTGCVYPLFSLNFEVKVSDSIRGITVSPQGWPDFTRLWIDETASRK